MTDYCTVQDVRNALTPDASGEIEYPETAASLPDWQIEDAIHEAMTVVDMNVRPRYMIATEEVDVPAPTEEDPDATTMVTVAKSPIRWWTRSVAAYYATLTFRKNKDLSEDDPIRLRYEGTMSNLMAVRDGAQDLFDFDPAEPGVSGDVTVVNQYEGKLFGPEDFGLYPEGFRPQILVPGRHW
jgi:hypothetical protein